MLTAVLPPRTWQGLRAVHREGGLARFYRGVLPELCGMAPKVRGRVASFTIRDSHSQW
jgi:hypothetical protein